MAELRRVGSRLVVISMFCLISACSFTLPPPVEPDDRIVCVIEPLKDLTGSYEALEPKFEQLIVDKFQDDYTHRYTAGSYPQKDMTTLISNNFTFEIASSSYVLPRDNALIISGTVEQIQYGSVIDIEGLIVDYHMLGLWRLYLGGGEDSRAGLVEYRLAVRRAGDNGLIRTFIIQGAYRKSKPDRAKILEMANKLAVEDFCFELNDNITEDIGKKKIANTYSGRVKRGYPSAIW